MSQLLISNIQRFLPLTDEEKYMILSIMKPKKIRKRQYLLQEGDNSKYSAFVLSGCLRCYFVDQNGFEHILQFAIEDWWIADMMSFTSGKSSRLNIDALEDAEVLLLTREDQLALFERSPKFEKYFRIITENGMISNQQRLLDNLSLPATDRYKNFINKYPLFMQRIPQTQIAAYLGITPEFLSKIRSQISKS
jgi:CRP-like cAMP-binding protein